MTRDINWVRAIGIGLLTIATIGTIKLLFDMERLPWVSTHGNRRQPRSKRLRVVIQSFIQPRRPLVVHLANLQRLSPND